MTIIITGSTVAWTRDCRPRWLLNELGIPYQLERVRLFEGGGHAPEHLAKHPLGRVPVLQDDGVTIWESGGVVAYLAEKYGAGKVVPDAGTPERARYHQWMFFAATSVEPAATRLFGAVRFGAGKPGSEERAQEARADLAKLRPALDPALERGPFILGERFSAADIMLGTSLHWADKAGGLSDAPLLKAYHDRLAARPAFQKTLAEGGD